MIAPSKARAVRRSFPDRWSSFLRECFGNPSRVAEWCAVDESTARSWWHGRTAPSGYVVALAFATRPDSAVQWLLRRCRVMRAWA